MMITMATGAIKTSHPGLNVGAVNRGQADPCCVGNGLEVHKAQNARSGIAYQHANKNGDCDQNPLKQVENTTDTASVSAATAKPS